MNSVARTAGYKQPLMLTFWHRSFTFQF